MKKFRKIMSVIIAVLMLITALPVASVSAGGDEYEITTAEPYKMWIGEDGETVAFRPAEDGWYKFYTTGDCDTYATLYNSDYDELDFSDDFNDDMNFHLKCMLYEGYTYFLHVEVLGLGESETAKFDLYVEEAVYVESVTITKEPDNTIVIEGFEYETLNYEGLELEFTLSDGSVVDWCYDIDGTVAGSLVYVLTGDDGMGHYYIDIFCDEAFTRFFYDTVENPLDYFEYSGTPIEFYKGTNGYYDKSEGVYYYCYDFPMDSEITVYYKDGTSEKFGIADWILGTYIGVADYQSSTPWVVGSDNYIELTLLDEIVMVPVTIHDVPFVNVTVDSAPVAEYVIGDIEFGEMDEEIYRFFPTDLTGLTFTVEYSDGTKKTYTDSDIDMQNRMIDDYMFSIEYIECASVGTYKAVLNYKGYDIIFDVNVVESPVADINVIKAPDRTEYEDIYYPVLHGMEIEVTYTDNTKETVTLTEENVEYILDGDLKYVVNIGENTIYIYDRYDEYEDTYYSSVTLLGDKYDYYGYNYIPSRDIENITAETITPDGDGAVLNVEYKNGDKETLTLETLDYYEYLAGEYEGYVMTENGISYYSIYPDYVDDEVVGYDVYVLGFSFYVDKAVTPEPSVTGLLGDADEDNTVNIKDATAIQKHIAGLITLTETGAKLADADGDGTVNIKDATAIQKHIAGMDTGFDIGKEI